MQRMAGHTTSMENKGIKVVVVTNEEMRNLRRVGGRQSTRKFIAHPKDFRQALEHNSISSYIYILEMVVMGTMVVKVRT